MFFSSFEPETNERLLREAGFEPLESRVESIHEPESEPGRGPQTVAFHWVLAVTRSAGGAAPPAAPREGASRSRAR
jgi:hypothetical protein